MKVNRGVLLWCGRLGGHCDSSGMLTVVNVKVIVAYPTGGVPAISRVDA